MRVDLIGLMRCGVIGVVLAVSAVGMPGVAIAQTDTTAVDLQRENDQLRQRVARLEAQLREANKRIRVLEARLDSDSGSGGGNGEKPDDGGLDSGGDKAFAETPTDPLACPASLRAALVTNYNEQLFANTPYEDRADKTRYIRGVQQWARKMEREFAGDIEWTIRLLGVQEESSQMVTLRFEVVEPGSGLAYGPETTAEVAKRMVGDLVDANPGTGWIVSGKVKAKVKVNRDRAETGEFDVPALIGPFAEDGYELFVKNVIETALP